MVESHEYPSLEICVSLCRNKTQKEAIAGLFGVTIDALFSLDRVTEQALLLPLEDDDVIRVVQLQGRKIIAVTQKSSIPT